MNRLRSLYHAVPLCAALLAPEAFAIPAAVQDFEDGSTQGWTAGGGPLGGVPLAPPTVVSGGAGGAADDYLQVTSTGGSGPGSRLSAINPAAWSGNYAGAGLTSIGMDLRNFGPSDLYIRLLLEDLSDLGQVSYAITAAVFLPSGSGWTDVNFSVAAADLIELQGDPAALLESVTHLRILGSGDQDWLFSPGAQPAVIATLGVDNITPNVFGDGDGGNGVPLPSTGWLVSLGLLSAAGLARQRRQAACRADPGSLPAS